MNADGQLLFEIRDLCKSFGDIEVLKNINTTISQGEVVVIVGPSGSGKSTFLRSLNLLEEPTGGQILFEGKDITLHPARPAGRGFYPGQPDRSAH